MVKQECEEIMIEARRLFKRKKEKDKERGNELHYPQNHQHQEKEVYRSMLWKMQTLVNIKTMMVQVTT